jgi:Tfp pilus assembly protein PilO
MKDERWILVILVCLFIILAILYIGTFTFTKIQTHNIRNLTAQVQQLESQMQQQNTAVNSFVSQLQTSKNMTDIDKILKTINVERIK